MRHYGLQITNTNYTISKLINTESSLMSPVMPYIKILLPETTPPIPDSKKNPTPL